MEGVIIKLWWSKSVDGCEVSGAKDTLIKYISKVVKGTVCVNSFDEVMDRFQARLFLRQSDMIFFFISYSEIENISNTGDSYAHFINRCRKA